MSSDNPDNKVDDFSLEDIEDLTAGMPGKQGGATDDLTAGAAADGPVDESLFNEVIRDLDYSFDPDNIDNLYDELMAMPESGPPPESDMALFAEPVLVAVRGREFEATLAAPFSPLAKTVSLQASIECPQKSFSLAELDYLGLVSRPQGLGLGRKTVSEIIETFGGRSEEVAVEVGQDFTSGVFCQGAGIGSRFKYFFFPADSIKSRCQTELTGQLLLAAGSLTNPVLEHALVRQQQLRALKFGQVLAKVAKLPAGAIEKVLQDAWRNQDADRKLKAGEILVSSGLVTRSQISEALKLQELIRNRKIGDMLVELKHLTEKQVYRVLADKFRRRFVDLADITVPEDAGSILSRELSLQLKVMPIAVEDGRPILATSRPELGAIAETLHRELGRPFELRVALPSQLSSLLLRKYSN